MQTPDSSKGTRECHTHLVVPSCEPVGRVVPGPEEGVRHQLHTIGLPRTPADMSVHARLLLLMTIVRIMICMQQHTFSMRAGPEYEKPACEVNAKAISTLT